MMLDFSTLNDDQLVSLIRAACGEAVERGAACQAAARDAYISAAEKADIAREAADREAAKLREEEARRIAAEAAEQVRRQRDQEQIASAGDKARREWARKRGIAEALLPLFKRANYSGLGGISVNVWVHATSKEKRIYIGKGYDANLITYYVTGGGRNAPGKLELGDKDFKPLSADVIAFCKALATAWTTIRFDAAEAIKWDGEAIPLPGYTPLPVAPPPPPVPATLRRALSGAFTECQECGATQWKDDAPIPHKDACKSRAQLPGIVAPVELPATLIFEHRSGIPCIVCRSCNAFCHPGEVLRHTRRCETTDTEIPAGWTPPPAPPAVPIITPPPADAGSVTP
jgi:hypothetical protein